MRCHLDFLTLFLGSLTDPLFGSLFPVPFFAVGREGTVAEVYLVEGGVCS